MADWFLKINTSQKSLEGRLRMISFKEGDQCILYLPDLGISGYGDTTMEAKELLDISMDAYVKELFKNPAAIIFEELENLGWKKQKFSRGKLRKLEPATYEDLKKEFNISEDAQVVESAISV